MEEVDNLERRPSQARTEHEGILEEESLEARVERLGRERPQCFKTPGSELAFCFSILMCQILAVSVQTDAFEGPVSYGRQGITEYFVSGFNIILPTLVKELSIPQAASTWPASAFSLVTASTLFIFGRLSDMYGGQPVYLFGLAWLTIWSLVAGFSQNELMMDFCRALQGFGPAAFLPSSVMILGKTYRPGPRKNLVFSIYGSCAVLGFYLGILISGVAAQLLRWNWYFWVGAILAFITTIVTLFAVPSDTSEIRASKATMDWLGAILLVPGLILLTFSITESSHAPSGWKTPYIPTLLVVGILFLAAFTYAEGWVSPNPLLPPSLFKIPHMTALTIALLFSFGNLGIYLLYTTFYMENILHLTPLLVVAYVTPMCVGGLILSTLGGLLLHLIPGTALLLFSSLAWVASSLLFALLPTHDPSYWSYIFPSMLCATLGIDIIYNATNVFVTTSLPAAQQGLAGSLVNSVLYFGIAILLGFSDIAQTQALRGGARLRESYKVVFWFEVACNLVALAVVAMSVRVGRARSELTVDERVVLERLATREVEREGERERGVGGGL
ncbi:MAG: hypothetical protein M1834_005206 [Cirrosporium novae-zelandiae]|nr:MAG: hypothetical protein M1834_005206 [Cirrosporium novae-zelandiae]